MNEKVFTVDNMIFVILIAGVTFWLTMVTSKGGLTDNRHVWYNRLTKRGRNACYIGFLIIIILACQEINNNRTSNNNKIDLKNEQDLRANKITQGVGSGVKIEVDKIFKGLSIAFKKQGLQYDSIKNQVTKLKDSVRVTNITKDTPLISLSNLEILDSLYFAKTYKVKYYITSSDAKSLNIDLKFDIFGITQNGEIRTIKRNIRIFYKGETIKEDETQFNNLEVPRDISYYYMYAFRLKGSYHSSYGKVFFIDKFYLLTPRVKSNSFTYPVQEHEDAFRAHLIRFSLN